LLRDAREANGQTLSFLVRRSGLAFDEAWLDAVENGTHELDEPLVRWLAELYGVGAGELVPARSELIIDLDEASVAAGGLRVPLERLDTEHLLTNYLALVHLLRGVPAEVPVVLRDADVNVLAHALHRNRLDVQSELERLASVAVRTGDARARTFRRRVVVPLAGILVGLTSLGGLVLVRAGRDDVHAGGRPTAVPGAASATADGARVDIGGAVVLERGGTQHDR
jgi:transcriptional regulator with XRE-family HTH domain